MFADARHYTLTMCMRLYVHRRKERELCHGGLFLACGAGTRASINYTDIRNTLYLQYKGGTATKTGGSSSLSCLPAGVWGSLSSEYGTCKTVKARFWPWPTWPWPFWPWPSGKTPYRPLSCSFLRSQGTLPPASAVCSRTHVSMY